AVVLRRATVVMSDSAANHRLADVAAAYDIVALQPTTEKAFVALCVGNAAAGAGGGGGSDGSGGGAPTIISLDLTASLGFYLRPRACATAVRRGTRFEICYAQALGADAYGRAN